jgi:tetratricopeptide (TPR) repeat protein
LVRAQALLASGQTEQGEALLRDILKRNPFELPALGLLVDLKVTQGKAAEMDERLSGLVKERPSTAEVHFLMGITRYALRDLARSETSLREAIRLKPNVKGAHQVLAELLLEKRDRAAARKAMQVAIEADPANIGNYLRLVEEYERDNDINAALAMLAAARKVDPSSPIVANHYAYLLVESGGDLNLALALAQEAKEKMPASPEVADTLGWVYHKRGMHDQALRQFRYAIQVKPEELAYYYHLGEVYAALGQESAAKAALEKCVADKGFPIRAKAEAALNRLRR